MKLANFNFKDERLGGGILKTWPMPFVEDTDRNTKILKVFACFITIDLAYILLDKVFYYLYNQN